MVVPCDCQIDVTGRGDRLRTYAQLGFLERMNFGTLRRNFRGVNDVPTFLKAKDMARDFADDPKGWLIFEGASGSGKTHFAAAIVNALIRRGAPAKYVSALDIPDLIRSGWSQGAEDFESDGYTPLLDAPVLVIDDFGVQPSAEWVDAKVDQLLTVRYNSRASTVVALAKPLADLPERHATKLGDPSLTRVINLTRVESDSAGLTESMLNEMSFETFNMEGGISATDEHKHLLNLAFHTSKNFVGDPTNSTPWLYLQGDTGVGKTHLAISIAGASIDKGVEVSYWSLPTFLDRLRQTYSTLNETDFFALFDAARDAELLILDDFGVQQMTDWSLEKLYQLLAYRHDRRLRTVVGGHYRIWNPSGNEEQTVIITTENGEQTATINKDNLPVLGGPYNLLQPRTRLLFEHQWLSIVSRLSDQMTVTVVTLAAPDYRNRGT